MLITSKLRSSTHFGRVTFTVIELCPFTNGLIADFFVAVLYLGLSKLNVKKLIPMLIATKPRSSLNFGGVTFTILELCPFTYGKIVEFFVLIL